MQDIAGRERRLAALGFERASPQPTSAAVPLDGGGWRLEGERAAMGTRVSVTVIGAERARLEEAVGRAFAEMDRLIPIFSRHQADSAVAALNDRGTLRTPPPELADVVSAGLRYHRLSHGGFDMTITPLLELFAAHFAARRTGAPLPGEVRDALARVGSSHVDVGWRRIRLRRGGMRLTLDGIAKGYIVDAMADELERHGVRRYLLNAGGDVRVRGTREDGAAWTVAVRDPADPGALQDQLPLSTGAVATSGSYEISFDESQTHHHIVDARLGRSPVHAASVSVIAPTAMAADALATAVFVLGAEQGTALIDRQRGCASLVIDRAGTRWPSRRWPGRPSMSREEYA